MTKGMHEHNLHYIYEPRLSPFQDGTNDNLLLIITIDPKELSCRPKLSHIRDHHFHHTRGLFLRSSLQNYSLLNSQIATSFAEIKTVAPVATGTAWLGKPFSGLPAFKRSTGSFAFRFDSHPWSEAL